MRVPSEINNILLHINSFQFDNRTRHFPNMAMLLLLKLCPHRKRATRPEADVCLPKIFTITRSLSISHLFFPSLFSRPKSKRDRCSLGCMRAELLRLYLPNFFFIASTTGFIHRRDSKETRRISSGTRVNMFYNSRYFKLKF